MFELKFWRIKKLVKKNKKPNPDIKALDIHNKLSMQNDWCFSFFSFI